MSNPQQQQPQPKPDPWPIISNRVGNGILWSIDVGIPTTIRIVLVAVVCVALFLGVLALSLY